MLGVGGGRGDGVKLDVRKNLHGKGYQALEQACPGK